MPFAWIFNLDAEQEMIRGQGGGRSVARRQRIVDLRPAVSAFLGDNDVNIDNLESGNEQGNYWGRAWCPTPTALERLRQWGAQVPDAPDWEVLCQVNHRRFSWTLSHLPGSRWVQSVAEVSACLSDEPGPWLLKQPWSFAGSGQRRLHDRAIDLHSERWIQGSFQRQGGLVMEPLVERVHDVALHGFLARNGDVRWGRPTRQTCDELGHWRASVVAPAELLTVAERKELVAAGEQVATALHAAQYFGPFGLDGFVWRQGSHRRFHPLSEVNGRYSMGWPVGMAGWQAPFA